MAYVVQGSFVNTYYANINGATPAATPDHLINDLIVAVVTQDIGIGVLSTASTGWVLHGTRTGTPAGGAYQQVFTKKATSNGTGEAPTFASTLADDGIIAMFVVRDVDTTTPVNVVSAQTNWNNVGFVDSPTVTTTSDECLVLYFWGSDGIPTLRSDFDDGILVGTGAFVGVATMVAYRQQQTAGVTPAMRMRLSVANEGGTSWVLAINNKAGGALAPDVRITGQLVEQYGTFGTATAALAWYGPEQTGNKFAGGFTSGLLGGITVTAGAAPTITTSLAGTLINTSNVNNVFDGAWHVLPSTSYLDKVFNVAISTLRAGALSAGRIGTEGVLVGFTDGTNYEFFTALRSESSWNQAFFYRFYVLCGRSTPKHSRGTLDWGAITGVCYLLHHMSTNPDSFQVVNAAMVDTHALTGGGASAPVSPKDIPIALTGNSYEANALAKLQSSSQTQIYFPLLVGDGTNKTYFRAAGGSTEYPQRLATTATAINPQYLWDVPAGYSGITVYASPSDTMDFSAALFATDLAREFTIHASSSTSATYNFSGTSLIGWNVTWKTGVPCNGASFARCSTIDFKGATVSNVTANTGTGTALCAVSSGFGATNCTFEASSTAIYGLRIAAAGSFTLDATTFSGFTKDIDVTAATGTVTITLADGQATPTFQTAGATVNIVANPTFQSVTVSGAVAGSRVQIYDTTNSVELFNGTSGYTWTDSVAAVAPRDIRVRIANQSGATAYNFIEANAGTCGTTAPSNIVTYLANQTLDAVYNANAIDGSTVTECSIVGTNLFVDVNAGSITISRIYAFMVYWLSTVGGIEDQTTEMVAKDTANYVVNTGFQIRNATTGPTIPLLITGGNIDPATGVATDILDTSGGSIFVNSSIVVPYSTGAGATIAIVQAGLSAQGFTTPVAARIDVAISTRATPDEIDDAQTAINAHIDTQTANLDAPVSSRATAGDIFAAV